MALADDIATDYVAIDGVETVTLTPQNPPAAAVPGITALLRELGRREIFGNLVGVQPDDVVWHLWSATMQGMTPKLGDEITAGPETFTIISLSYSPQTRRWRCVCRKKVS